MWILLKKYWRIFLYQSGPNRRIQKITQEKLHNLRASPNIIMVVKLGRIRVSGRNVGDDIKSWLYRNNLWKSEGRLVLDKAKCPAFVNMMVDPLVL